MNTNETARENDFTHYSWRRKAPTLLLIFVIALVIRSLTAYFVGTHLDDAGWFQFGSYKIFDERAQNIIDGNEPIFLLSDATRTDLIQYPPGFPALVGLVYLFSGERSAFNVHRVQWPLDAVLTPFLILGIAVSAFGWRVGYLAGLMAAVSPLLAFYGVSPSADAPTMWLVLASVWLLLITCKRQSWRLGFASGVTLGLACWFRVNPLFMIGVWAAAVFLFVSAGRAMRLRLALALVGGAAIVVAPIMIRNFVVFGEFVTGLSVGANLWEGLGETELGRDNGFKYGDDLMIETERLELGLSADFPIRSFWPDGIRRDHERARRSLSLIAQHPLWYSGVMLGRMYWMLKIAGEPGPYYGTAGINCTPAKCLSADDQRSVAAGCVLILGATQSVYRYLAIPFAILGIAFAYRRNRQSMWLLLATVLYYLVTSSAAHTEVRYVLPMHAVLVVFSSLGCVELVHSVWTSLGSHTDSSPPVMNQLVEEKRRAREQWSEDPCGEIYGKELEFGTREFFDEVERHRYAEYAPWMREVMGFDRFAGAHLVEVGCGMGTDLLQFARGGATCTGVDLTPRSVEISRLHFDAYDARADFAMSDAERLPFADETFEVFYSNGVLHHTPDTEAAVHEAHRVLKPGGTAKVMLYHRNSWGYWVEMMLKQGIVRGEFFRGRSRADLLSKYVEFNDAGGRPLVKVYSRAETRAMFSMFRNVKIEVEQLTRREVYFVGKLIPESIFRAMRRSIGWNIIVTAVK